VGMMITWWVLDTFGIGNWSLGKGNVRLHRAFRAPELCTAPMHLDPPVTIPVLSLRGRWAAGAWSDILLEACFAVFVVLILVICLGRSSFCIEEDALRTERKINVYFRLTLLRYEIENSLKNV
jgi:hypothetical protein